MVKVHQLKYSLAIAQAVVPKIGNMFSGKFAQSALSFIEIGAQILQGKGSGTGWDLAAEYKAASRYIREGSIVFDVGANKGDWTKAVLGLNPKMVYMFEPQQSCVERYLRSMEGPCCKVINSAVGDCEGEADFYSPGETEGHASLYNRKDTYFAGQNFCQSKVRICTLDNFIRSNKIDHVDFMKIDVEGHELSVLKGAEMSIKDRIFRAIAFEFGSASIYSKIFFRDFWDFLGANDYKIYRIIPGGGLVEITSYYEDLEHFRGVSNYIAELHQGSNAISKFTSISSQ